MIIAATVAASILSVAARADIVPFTDEAISRGVVYVMPPPGQVVGAYGNGCGFVDLDDDGDADLVILGAASQRVGIFENNGGGVFTNRSLTSGIPILSWISAFAAADYDNDGDLDLYITRIGKPNVLARNDGGFSFTDVAAAAGVADLGAGKGAAWADFDLDGHLDLYVCNYNGIVPGTGGLNNRLYRNNGNGTFTDIAPGMGMDDHGLSFQVSWCDYDRDGDVDLYLSNDRGHQPPLFRANQLWRNDGARFTNVSEASGTKLALYSMGVACGDFDGNGWPDLYCTNLDYDAAGYNPLLLNQGDGTFIESSARAGVDHWTSSWGAMFWDFDNDGTVDLYVNNAAAPNALYTGGNGFPCTDIAVAAGVVGSAGPSFCAAFADIDGDGDLDLLMNNLSGNVQLFINHEGERRHAARFRLIGPSANRSAIGGSIDVRVGDAWSFREVQAGTNGYLGQNEMILHVGIGDATVADELVARWPGGETRTLVNIPTGWVYALHRDARLGDADGDEDVDLDDFLAFAPCYGHVVGPGCEVMDFDGNGAIDEADFLTFVDRFDGVLIDCNDNGISDLEEILADPDRDADGDGLLDDCTGPPADFNGDGAVNAADLAILLAAWGPCHACPPDLDSDGTVGAGDLAILLSRWTG
jgi:hypothetical protein